MNERALYERLKNTVELSDFSLKLVNECNQCSYADYFIDRKLILVYTLNEEGKTYGDLVIEREALHELSHHIQYHHTQGIKPCCDNAHGRVFRRIYAKLLSIYYSEHVPCETINYLREEGYIE